MTGKADALAALTVAAAAVEAARKTIDALEEPAIPPPPPPAGVGFRVTGADITDPDGKPFTPRGINLTGADSYVWDPAWSAHGRAGWWQDTWGLNAIRVVYCADCHESHPPGSQHYGDLDALIGEYTARRMVVIIDNHEGRLGDPNGKTPAEIQAAIDLFVPLARKWRDNPYVWFEPFNEPLEEGWQTPASHRWVEFTRPVVEAIRRECPNVVVVCASHYGQDRASTGEVVPAESSVLTFGPELAALGNVVFDVHVYSRWGDGAATDAQLADYFARVRAAGLAVLVGETGGYDAAFRGAVAGDDTGTQRLYRVAPRGVGIFPWMVGQFTAGDPQDDDPSGLHRRWVAAQRGTTGGGSGGGVPVFSSVTAAGREVTVVWEPPVKARVAFGWAGAWRGTTVETTPPVVIAAAQDGTPVPADTLVSVDLVVDGAVPAHGAVRTPPGSPAPTTGKAVSPGETGAAPAAQLTRIGPNGSAVELRQGPFGTEVWVNQPGTLEGVYSPWPIIWAGAGELTLRNCRVDVSTRHHNGVLIYGSQGSAVLERCTVTRSAQAASYGNGAVQSVSGQPVRMVLCDLSGYADGFQGGEVRAERCWVHDNHVVPGAQGTHNDGVQVWTAAELTECLIQLPPDPGRQNVNAGLMMMAGCSAQVNRCRFEGGGCAVNKSQGGTLVERDNEFVGPFLYGAIVG